MLTVITVTWSLHSGLIFLFMSQLGGGVLIRVCLHSMSKNHSNISLMQVSNSQVHQNVLVARRWSKPDPALMRGSERASVTESFGKTDVR